MKNRLEMDLVGYDGNIFSILGRASRLLKQNDMREESDEMFERVTASHDYYAALGIISEYVQTDISGPDHGILESDDIRIDSDMTVDKNGVTAYVETWFDTARRFGVRLEADDSIDLYATVQPESGKLSASIIIKRESGGAHECVDVALLSCERKLILGKMEEAAQDKSLKALYDEWRCEHGGEQAKLKDKGRKKQYER